MAWPPTTSLAHLERGTFVAPEGPAEAVAPTEPTASDLGATLSETIAALGKLGEVLKSVESASKEAVPTLPEPEESPQAESGGTKASAGAPAAATPSAGPAQGGVGSGTAKPGGS